MIMPNPNGAPVEPDRTSYINQRCVECHFIAPTWNRYHELVALRDALRAQHPGGDYESPEINAELDEVSVKLGELSIVTSACGGLQYYMYEGFSTDVQKCGSSLKPKPLPYTPEE